MAEPQHGMWLYRDQKGEVHLVLRASDIPAEHRQAAIPVGREALETVADARLLDRARSMIGTPELPAGVDPSSFALGFASAAALAVALVIARFASRWVLRVVIVAIVIAAGSVGYLTFVRQQAGFSGVATPDRIIEDARRAAELAREHLRQKEQALQELE